MDTLWIIAKVVLAVEIIVIFHMLGHLIAAKLVGIAVSFHLGLGPAIPGCRFRRGKDSYLLGVFLLGGYVTAATATDSEHRTALDPLPPAWRRLTFICGGMLMNVILAWSCFTLSVVYGTIRTAAVVDIVDSGSPAW